MHVNKNSRHGWENIIYLVITVILKTHNKTRKWQKLVDAKLPCKGLYVLFCGLSCKMTLTSFKRPWYIFHLLTHRFKAYFWSCNVCHGFLALQISFLQFFMYQNTRILKYLFAEQEKKWWCRQNSEKWDKYMYTERQKKLITSSEWHSLKSN